MPTTPSRRPPSTTLDPPRTRPSLPIVRFGGDAPGLEVLFSTKEAAESARTFLDDEYYDVRGILLTRVDSHLEARGEADPADLQRRLIVETRRAAEATEQGLTAELEAVLRWQAAAPSAEYMVHGLACARLEYDDTKGRRCHRCDTLQRMYRSDCCPR